MKKRLIVIMACVVLLSLCLLAFTACDLFGKDGVGIEKIEKSGSEGLVDTYTITLTNGETSTFTVTNGESGGNGLSTDDENPSEDIFFFNLLEDDTYEVYARYHDMPKKVVIPATYKGKIVTKIAENFGAFAEDCFNRTVEEIVIPDSVTSIGKHAFEGYQALSSVTISSGLTSISDYAFYGCFNLSSVTIPSSVTSFEPGAFSGCKKLLSVHYGGTMEQWGSFKNWMGYGICKYLPNGCVVHCADGDIINE